MAKQLLIGKDATKTKSIPQEFLNFFNCKYVNRVGIMPHQWPGTAVEMNVYPLLTIEKTTSNEAHDFFQLNIKRTEADGDVRVLPSTDVKKLFHQQRRTNLQELLINWIKVFYNLCMYAYKR